METFGDAPENTELLGSPEPSWLATAVPSPLLEQISINLPEDHPENYPEATALQDDACPTSRSAPHLPPRSVTRVRS